MHLAFRILLFASWWPYSTLQFMFMSSRNKGLISVHWSVCLTGDINHEREDHCHILKKTRKHTREGGPEWVDLQGFDEALTNPTTGLAHAALSGERKQSVQDAANRLSFKVASFLKTIALKSRQDTWTLLQAGMRQQMAAESNSWSAADWITRCLTWLCMSGYATHSSTHAQHYNSASIDINR